MGVNSEVYLKENFLQDECLILFADIVQVMPWTTCWGTFSRNTLEPEKNSPELLWSSQVDNHKTLLKTMLKNWETTVLRSSHWVRGSPMLSLKHEILYFNGIRFQSWGRGISALSVVTLHSICSEWWKKALKEWKSNQMGFADAVFGTIIVSFSWRKNRQLLNVFHWPDLQLLISKGSQLIQMGCCKSGDMIRGCCFSHVHRHLRFVGVDFWTEMC